MSVSYTVHLRLEKQSSPTNGALAGGPTDASATQPCLDLSDHDLTGECQIIRTRQNLKHLYKGDLQPRQFLHHLRIVAVRSQHFIRLLFPTLIMPYLMTGCSAHNEPISASYDHER
jgi:hypothetical protein